MSRATRTISIHGGPTHIALGALRYLVRETEGQPDETLVRVKVDGPYSNPTDPGHSSLSVTVEESL